VTYDANNCPVDCEDIDNCGCEDLICGGCQQPNYETCSCDPKPNCECPEGTPAGADPETCECATPSLPEGVTSDGCYELKDNNNDGCDEYVFKCGELGCAEDGSGCCAVAKPECKDCEKPIMENGCYTGECEFDETLTYEVWGHTLKCNEDVCFCTTKQLYYCANGAAAYTICCNPRNGGCGKCDPGWHPDAYWFMYDLGDKCLAVEGGPDLSQFDLPGSEDEEPEEPEDPENKDATSEE
jgi:hypothetical protein